MTLAREAVLRGALPLTGILSSIGTLNPPLSVGVLLPTALFTKDPLPAVVLLALWNVLGVALLYIFTLRYFGRMQATVAALLFATCGAAVNYSRFLWQQNYLPPLLVLWAWTLYAGCVRGAGAARLARGEPRPARADHLAASHGHRAGGRHAGGRAARAALAGMA